MRTNHGYAGIALPLLLAACGGDGAAPTAGSTATAATPPAGNQASASGAGRRQPGWVLDNPENVNDRRAMAEDTTRKAQEQGDQFRNMMDDTDQAEPPAQ